MKKFIKVLIKIIIFFFVWAILGGIINIPSDNPALWRFWAEAVPFVIVLVDTVIFWIIEKREITIIGYTRPLRNSIIGVIAGLMWVLVPTTILYFMNIISFVKQENTEMLWLWMLSMFINTIMQELLVRGYMYQLIKKEYNVIPAIIFTTILFTVFHGGAFEAGVIAVINVATMSLAMSFALEYTKSLITPILMHAIYNLIDGIVLGTGTVVEYPHIFSAKYHGPNVLTGGSFEMSGSIVVTIVNIILMAIFLTLWIRKCRKNIAIANTDN